MLLLAFTVTACDNDSPEPENPDTGHPGNNDGDEEAGTTPTPGGNGRYLVVFSSRTGNTKAMAEEIQRILDCDILEVEPTLPYDGDYNSMLKRAQQEQAAIGQGNYPTIRTFMDDFNAYDIIFVGYPIWYSHLATPMRTFLHNHSDKLAGKQIALFASSGSSGMGTSVSEARSLCPDATFTETLLLTSSGIGQLSTRIVSWLEQIGAEQNSNN